MPRRLPPDDPRRIRFDAEAGRRARDHSIRQADAAAHEAWKVAYDIAIKKAALKKPFITVDDVLVELNPNVWTHENRAAGARMLAAAKAGIIRKTKIYPIETERPWCHRGRMTVWESLIYKPRYH
jgi:hypothetical protein